MKAFNKIEVRPQGQLPKHSGPQGGMEQNPLLSNTATAAILAAGLNPQQLVANPFGLPPSASPLPGSWPSSYQQPGLSSSGTPLPGLGGGADFSSAGVPPAYKNGPPPMISAEAAAAAAASMAKDEEDDELSALIKD